MRLYIVLLGLHIFISFSLLHTLSKIPIVISVTLKLVKTLWLLHFSKQVLEKSLSVLFFYISTFKISSSYLWLIPFSLVLKIQKLNKRRTARTCQKTKECHALKKRGTQGPPSLHTGLDTEVMPKENPSQRTPFHPNTASEDDRQPSLQQQAPSVQLHLEAIWKLTILKPYCAKWIVGRRYVYKNAM